VRLKPPSLLFKGLEAAMRPSPNHIGSQAKVRFGFPPVYGDKETGEGGTEYLPHKCSRNGAAR